MLSAVEEFSRKARGMKLGVKVKDVAEELFAAKRQDGLSHRYLLQLQSNLRRRQFRIWLPVRKGSDP